MSDFDPGKAVHETPARTIPGTDTAYRVGSEIIYLAGGRPTLATVTGIYPHLNPPTWDGTKINWDPELEQGGIDSTAGIWSYESEILSVEKF